MHKAITSLLTGRAELVALVGSRIYSGTVAQDEALPYVYFERQDVEVFQHLTGDAGLVESIVEVNCVANSVLEMIAVADEVRIALSRKRGVFGAETVQDIQHLGSDDLTLVPASGQELGVYERSSAFTIWWET